MATLQEIADEARDDLRDTDATNLRWSDAQMLEHVNAAVRAIVEKSPEANVVEEAVDVLTGVTRKVLPDRGVKFLRAWNLDNSGTTTNWVAGANTLFSTDLVMSTTSVDGTGTWRNDFLGDPTPVERNVEGIAFSPTLNIWVMVVSDGGFSDGDVFSSTDMITWTDRQAGTIGTDKFYFHDIRWVDTWALFICSGFSGTELGRDYIYSANGIDWTSVAHDVPNGGTALCIEYSPSLNYAIMISNYGLGGNEVFRIDSPGTSVSSPGWTAGQEIRELTWDATNNLFIGVNTSGHIYTSPTGETWTQRYSGATGAVTDVAYSAFHGLTVAIKSSGSDRIMTSTNGTTWVDRDNPTFDTQIWEHVDVSSGGDFVAVSDSPTAGHSRVATSSDGITWTVQTVTFDETWNKVKAGDVVDPRRGPAMTIVEKKDALDNTFPEWMYNEAYATHLEYPDAATEHTMEFFDHYSHDPREPKTYYVFPAPAADTDLYIQYSKLPADSSALTDTFPLGDEWLDAAVAYTMYRMISKDTMHEQGSHRAQSAYNDFLRAIGMKPVADQRVDPTTQRPPGDNLG